METFRFAHPWALYLLLLVPVIIALMLLFRRSRRKALARFGDNVLISHLMPDFSSGRVKFKAWVFIIAFTLQVIVVAGPQFGSKLDSVQRKGIEIMVALDVSNSMNAQDVAPSRMENAKRAVSMLVDKLQDDRVGLVVFAGNPYVQLPITSDYPSAKMFLHSVSTGMVPTQGTAIGAAIDLCVSSFAPVTGDKAPNRAVIVITDGENHEDDAVEAAQRAQQNGVLVYTVGMGTSKGAPVPTIPGQNHDFIKDKDGNVVISKIDEASLAQVARAGGGEYIPASNLRSGINSLVSKLNSIEKSEIEAKVFKDYEDRFPYIEGVVLFLLLVDLLILSRKNPKLASFDIFTRKNADRDLFIQPSQSNK